MLLWKYQKGCKRMKTRMLKRFLAFALAALMLLPMLPPMEAEAAGYEESLLPNMGWSSWNNYANNITEEICLEQMDLMIELGLYDVGYNYFNIDDGYQGGRVNGKVVANSEKFPHGMKYIADEAHKRGMKAGIYSDIGDNTCASRANGEGNSNYQNKPGTGYGLGVGLYGYEEQDLRMYFQEWGFDFIKVDWCGGQHVGMSDDTRIEKYIAAGQIIEELRNELGRDLMYNVCCWEFPWDQTTGDKSASAIMARIEDSCADSWRTGGDLWADFSSVTSQIDRIKNIDQYSGPGYHHDLDMLQVGRGLSYEEDVTHFSMWCMMSSPLMIGADLSKISEESLSILKNEEMIAIDQDPAGICADYKKTFSNVEYWVKDLGKANSTTKAIALMNRSNTAQTVTVTWSEFALNGKVTVRDLWQHKYLNVGDSYTVTIPAHGTVVYKVEADSTTDTGVAIPGTANITFGNKNATMDLTQMGSGDWIYYGNANDTTTRRKANVIQQIDYTGNQLGRLNTTDCYNDAATAYSWTDGTDGSGNAVTSGMTIGKTLGSFGQVDAVADERTRTLYVPITAWQSDVKVEVYLGGKLMGEETFVAEDVNGQKRVNKMVTVTYSAEAATTLSVKWTIVNQYRNNGNTAFEAAALTAVSGDPIGLYPSGTENYIGGYTAKEKVANGAILIDVRSASEFEKGHIDGAVNIPWSASFVSTVKELYPDTGKEIIVYCLTGKRSFQSRDALQYAGYTNVWDMGSMEHWTDVPKLIFKDSSMMIKNNTALTISVYGAENDNVELRYSVGKDSTVNDSRAYNGSFTLGQTGDVTAKAYLLYKGEVIAENSCEYLVFDNSIPELPANVVYCSDLTPKNKYVAYNDVMKDTNCDGEPMVMAGRSFSKGIGTHAPADVTYNIPDGATRFVAAAGMDDDVKNATTYSIVYSVYIDGVKMDRTVILPKECFYVFDIQIPEGAKELRLVCEQGNSSTHKNTNMHSEWGIAAFTFEEREVAITLPGDVNMDNKVNVVDIMTIKSLISRGTSTEQQLVNGDLSGNGVLDTADIAAMKALILAG